VNSRWLTGRCKAGRKNQHEVHGVRLFREIPRSELSVVSAMLERGINRVMTSSCGRLFDAVAAMIGLRNEVKFEGQAAIERGAITQPGISEEYPLGQAVVTNAVLQHGA
jgi:hydrogenase maturation factor HypF (carbamoyltransferase family)